MIYLTDDDLLTDSFQRFIDESSKDNEDVVANAELKCIGIIKTMLKGRYNTELIFDETDPVRDEFLADILTKLTLHKIFGRNAARKVPTDVKDNYDWAMKQLGLLNAGKLQLELPSPTNTDGTASAAPMFGNNTNPDFYI
ncbi:hypothetical protein FORMB_25360 [Formosa sp. Hel1_33_131]|uniref:phage protein Gp36 family protein n=1 Tax=Formosa sp. Hel1_33_131 TaxID=1336794 RepID=UPI00084E103E|nr:phage protein Gp36 family protein [Formosa sp. Hel1_33_131]AOR29553.1 hypothetical protein FORMB_25360 [Formosa sp. Hel1_33_131]